MNRRYAVCASAFLAGAWGCLGTEVGYHQTQVVTVPADTTVEQTDEIVLSDGGIFAKSGAGKLKLPLAKVAQGVTEWEIRNQAGEMLLTAGADATAGARPAIIAAKAALWLTADSAVTTNGADGAAYVKKWVDVRDKDNPDAPTHVYATPAWGTLAPEASSNHPPVRVTKDGTDALFFGGPTSGKYMKFSSAVTYIRQNFVVHGVDTCWGAVLGSSSSRRGMVPNTYAGCVVTNSIDKHFSERSELNYAYSAGRFYLDGVNFDPYTTPPRQGFQLLECRFPASPDSNNQIFRSGFETVAKGDADLKLQGGDYVSEIILFTNVLSEAERVSVERYLMKKWSLPKRNGLKAQYYLPPVGVLTAAADATTELDAEADTSLPLLELRGNGTFTKTGAGTLALGPSAATSFTGTFLWEDGTLFSRGGRPLPVKATAGDTFDGSVYTPYTPSVAREAGIDIQAGAKLTRTHTAGSTCVTKTGNDWARVNEVAEGVRTIDVKAGVLALEAKVTGVDDPPAIAPIVVTNGDFELAFAADQSINGRGALSKNAANGWTGTTGYYIAWTNVNALTWFDYSASTARYCPPPSGSQVLLINQGYDASVTVDLPVAGWYELTLYAKERYGTGYATGDSFTYGEVSWGASGGTLASVGRLYPSGLGYSRYALRLPYSAAGRYKLKITGTTTGSDGSILVDDVEIHAVGHNPEVAAFKVPNGDFETITPRATKPYYRGQYSLLNIPTGWTFDTSGSSYPNALTNAPIGIVSPAISLNGSTTMLCGLNDLLPGCVRLFFAGTGATAQRTFTAPAGRFRLRADAARQNVNMIPSGYKEAGYPNVPVFQALLTLADGTVTNLGSVTRSDCLAQSSYWPNEFELAAEQSVTLTVKQTSAWASGWLDNLEFVAATTYAAKENLFRNPDAESSLSYWKKVDDHSFFKNSFASVRSYNTNTKYYGYAAFSGNAYFYFQSRAMISQVVSVPEAGNYRLKCHCRTRGDNTSYSGNNIQIWWCAAGTTATNYVDTILMPYSGNFLERAYLVKFPAAGDYEVGFSGQGVLSAGASADRESHMDGLSLAKIEGTLADAPVLPAKLRVAVAKGARLVLDYPGRVCVRSLRLDGVAQPAGIVSAQTHPDYIGGAGELEIKPAGIVLNLR